MKINFSFVPGQERAAATKAHPEAQVTVKVFDGFLCFESWHDYHIWKETPGIRPPKETKSHGQNMLKL